MKSGRVEEVGIHCTEGVLDASMHAFNDVVGGLENSERRWIQGAESSVQFVHVHRELHRTSTGTLVDLVDLETC